jgi:hypothetical protein
LSLAWSPVLPWFDHAGDENSEKQVASPAKKPTEQEIDNFINSAPDGGGTPRRVWKGKKVQMSFTIDTQLLSWVDGMRENSALQALASSTCQSH